MRNVFIFLVFKVSLEDTMSNNKLLRLGERELQLVFAFEERGQRIFTIKDAKTVLGGSDASVKNVLKRLAVKKRVIRIERGKYLFVPMRAGREGWWSEESFAVIPYLVGKSDYYIGLLTALHYWGMTEQIPLVVYVVMRKRKKCLKAFGMNYVFVNMELGDFQVVESSGTKVNMSSREQTILDCLAHPEYSLGVAGVSQALNSAGRGLDWLKLVRLCLKEKEVVRRRLGYLLELTGKEKQARKLEARFKGFTWLDPTLEKRRLGYSKKWGLILNVSKERLLEYERGY
jgi:predicted transcriptional regulator of viral defense system